MTNFTSKEGVFNSIQGSVEFAVEAAKLDFALELKRMMDQSNINNAELAERLDVSRPMITKLLRGDTNATIETMVKASRAVGGEFFVRIVRKNCTPRLFELAKTERWMTEGGKRKNPYSHLTDTMVWRNFYQEVNGNEEKPIAA